MFFLTTIKITNGIKKHMNNNKLISFDWNREVVGGTEYMASNVVNKIIKDLDKFKNYYCVCFPGALDLSELFDGNKPIIYWLHNHIDQLSHNIQDIMFSDEIKEKIKFVVVVSETHKKVLSSLNLIDDNKIVVIPNAIDPLLYNSNKFNNINKIKIVHTSAPDRGMLVLLESLKYINHDIELNIFNDFYPEKVLEIINYNFMNDKRVNFYGKTPKQTVKKYIEQSHIHAYPGLFRETFCISQAEAMSAGCLCVYGNIEESSLKEISNNFGIFDEMIVNNDYKNVEKFAGMLNTAIEKIKNKNFDPLDQINWINNKYSWDEAYKNWSNFHNLI